MLKSDSIKAALNILKNSGVIIIPTETVYGIAVDATNNLAIEKIYRIKARDKNKPLQIMCDNLSSAKKIAKFDSYSEAFCSNHWPGALTAILNIEKHSSDDNKPEGKSFSLAPNLNLLDDSIGIRIPDHNLTLDLLHAFGRPIAVSSANISGEKDVTRCSDISPSIIDQVDLVIDGGNCNVGMASTVIDFRNSAAPKIIRQGSVVL